MIPKSFSSRLRDRLARTYRPDRQPAGEREETGRERVVNEIRSEREPVKKEPLKIDTSNAEAQSQSPLFSKIPPEIRNEIFYLAFQEYTDPNKLYERETFYTRPGVEGKKRIDVALLRTCKQVYAETKALPLLDAEAVFYLGANERAVTRHTLLSHQLGYSTQHGYGTVYAEPALQTLTDEQWARFDRVHVFGQMYAIPAGLGSLFTGKQGSLAPSTLTVTLRYTDWFFWERNTPIYPIRADHFIPMNRIALPNSVTKVFMEFEYTEANVKQLMSVVDEMFTRRDWWYWKRKDGRKLVVRGRDAKEEGAVREWKWQGPTKFQKGGRRYPHHGNGDLMGYVVKVVTWELTADHTA